MLITFIKKQQIFLRGHRDSDPMLSKLLIYNDGNFRSLLRFHVASRDNNLNNHQSRIEAMSSNRSPSNIRPKTQNESIEICGKVILDKIVSKVNY